MLQITFVKRIIILSALVVMTATNLWAKPIKGFNEGPFIYLTGGVAHVDFDKDQQTGKRVGDDFEPNVGFIFGWNTWDWLAPELEGRYSTNKNGGRREHIVDANINAKYFLIFDELTKFESIKIMPTVKGGFGFRIASLPGNVNSKDSAVTTFGWGPSFGAGLSFLALKYLSFGIEAQEDLLFFNEVRQDLTINGVPTPNVLIYKGGFHPQFSAMFFIGVHY